MNVIPLDKIFEWSEISNYIVKYLNFKFFFGYPVLFIAKFVSYKKTELMDWIYVTFDLYKIWRAY